MFNAKEKTDMSPGEFAAKGPSGSTQANKMQTTHFLLLTPTPATESCALDQSCVSEEETDEQSSQLEGSDPSDIILRLLHLTGHTSPHRIH